jgi:hypothetical protein
MTLKKTLEEMQGGLLLIMDAVKKVTPKRPNAFS